MKATGLIYFAMHDLEDKYCNVQQNAFVKLLYYMEETTMPIEKIEPLTENPEKEKLNTDLRQEMCDFTSIHSGNMVSCLMRGVTLLVFVVIIKYDDIPHTTAIGMDQRIAISTLNQLNSHTNNVYITHNIYQKDKHDAYIAIYCKSR